VTATLTKQMVHAYWHILEDYPTKDGEYVVCFHTDDGTFGYPDVWEFSARDGWQPLFGLSHETQPTHWCNLPMPK
jgi:hypothetical protein